MNGSLQKVINILETQTALAEKIGTGQATVSAWINRYNGLVGPDFVIKVSQAVDWVVTPHQLRPDIYPHPDDGMPTSMRCKCEDQAA